MTISVSSDYGYVILVGASAALYQFVLGGQVSSQRKPSGVLYPHMYATKAECEQDKKKLIFNCYQRAHQNYLENLPSFLFFLSAGGLEYPKVAAAAGTLWLLGRIKYSSNYQKGDASKRNSSGAAVHYLGLLSLLGLSAYTGVKQIANL
ncbi:Microsomal glutathione S-transferase 3 [Chytriomyces hyalinus]|nr:Microsomal glutathione S-transferase 3 [Chytriomyces hyalinus]